MEELWGLGLKAKVNLPVLTQDQPIAQPPLPTSPDAQIAGLSRARSASMVSDPSDNDIQAPLGLADIDEMGAKSEKGDHESLVDDEEL